MPRLVTIETTGNFNNLEKFLKLMKNQQFLSDLRNYGEQGVLALQSATPVDTGLTRDSWSYEVVSNGSGVQLRFLNSNRPDGFLVAIMLQYGHGTREGGWVQGYDYINPAIRPIFDEIAKDIWEEVTKS